MLSLVTRLFRKRSKSQSSHRLSEQCRRKPQVESLEARDVPATTVLPKPSAFPNAATTYIESTWDVNKNKVKDSADYTLRGSGAMVSRYQTLTAGHVLYDMNPKTPVSGWATWVQVFPGYHAGVNSSYGSAWSTRLHVPTAWTTGNTNADLGVITLNKNIGNRTGYFGYGYLNDTYLKKGLTVNMLHYPGKETGFDGQGKQWGSSGPVAGVNADTFWYNESDIRSVGGSSGAPVYVYNLNVDGKTWNRIIVGVNVRSTDGGTGGTATAIRLNQTWYPWLKDTLAKDPAPAV
jgi:V8-like Glu-specific endopeptidase